MNGILARDNFEIAGQMFNAAFNPKVLASGQVNPNYNPNWDAVTDFRMTQGTVRLEQLLVTTSAVYTFPVLNNIPTPGAIAQFNTEIRLTNQDSFIPTEVGLFTAKPTGSFDNTFLLKSYPGPVTFTNYVPMQAIYNGVMKMAFNNVNYMIQWDTFRHYYVPQTQVTGAPAAGSPIDEIDGGENAFYPMQPFIIITGTQNINLTVNLQSALTAVDANSRLIIVLRGIYALNSTVTN